MILSASARSVSGLRRFARPAALLRDQPAGAVQPISLQQPQRLAAAEADQLRRRGRRQPPLIQIPQHLKPRQLLVAHDPQPHAGPPSAQRAGVSCLTGTGVTFSSGRVGSRRSATEQGTGRRAGAEPSRRAEPDRRPAHRRSAELLLRARRKACEHVGRCRAAGFR